MQRTTDSAVYTSTYALICPPLQHWPWRLTWGSRPLTPVDLWTTIAPADHILQPLPRDLLCLWLADSAPQQVSISQQPTNIRATPGAGQSQVPTNLGTRDRPAQLSGATRRGSLALPSPLPVPPPSVTPTPPHTNGAQDWSIAINIALYYSG